MSQFRDILSPADIEYILSLPDVLSARDKIDSFPDHASIHFTITLTDSLRETLLLYLNLDLSTVNEIPMRWIKGDTLPHIDKGASEFDNTYLVYLNDSEGQFILEDTSFPIERNTGFVFNEGLMHKTENTGSLPRLLLGPMNELAEPVGVPGQGIYYYSNKVTADTRANGDLEDALAYSSSYTVGQRNALFNEPRFLAFDTDGNLFVGDNDNCRIRKITPGDEVSTFAGSGTFGELDGQGVNAQFGSINGLAFNDGNLFVADTHKIRKITSGGTVSTFAGSTQGYADSAPEADPQFDNPSALAFDGDGNLFVSDGGNHVIRKITSGGVVSTFSGLQSIGGFEDGLANVAKFSSPSGLAFDGVNLFVADSGNHRIRKITPDGTVTTFAGSTQGYADSDLEVDPLFSFPRGLAFDGGNLFVADSGNHRIRKITPDGTVSTFAGSTQGYLDAPSLNAQFNNPRGLAFNSGNLFVADRSNHVIRKITSGVVSTFAGVYNVTGFMDTDTPLPSTHWKISETSDGSSNKTLVYNNGQELNNDVGTKYYLYPLPSGAVCFLEGTKVLCLVGDTQQYLPIESLTKDVLVKTSRDGYKKIELIAKEEMNNPGTDERIEPRLYKCSTSKYPELKDDLFITGCHSILVDKITDKEKDVLTRQLGRIFVTDKKYRLTAYADERAEPWNSEGKYTIWHIVLEHENPVMNYGIYVNGGLLVESCSKHVLKNKSNMIVQ